MRIDKLTTKFQEALADAQSIAVGRDNAYIEPQHILAALLAQADGSTRSLLQRAGVNLSHLQSSLQEALDQLPKVEGSKPGSAGPRCHRSLEPGRQGCTKAWRPVHCQRDVSAGAG